MAAIISARIARRDAAPETYDVYDRDETPVRTHSDELAAHLHAAWLPAGHPDNNAGQPLVVTRQAKPAAWVIEAVFSGPNRSGATFGGYPTREAAESALRGMGYAGEIAS